jgi:thioredoxin-dependent peroxiredoxin
VVGVSRDSQETNDRFRKSLDLPFPLVGDPKGRITTAYKVRWPIIGLARRVTYVVGPDRRIRLAYHSELDATAHVGEVCTFVARSKA